MAAPIKAVGPKSDKEWRDALRIVVHEPISKDDKRKKLRRIAEVVVDAAMAGDMIACKEIGDRLDGRPSATVGLEHSGTIAHEYRELSATASLIADALGEPAESAPKESLH